MNASSPSQQPLQAARPPAPRPTTQMSLGCFAIPVMVAVALLGTFFYVRAQASNQLTVPDQDVALVRSAPHPSAPLLARFGQGTTLIITGRTEDWRWLEVEFWESQRGWILRPLDILVWQIAAEPTSPLESKSSPSVPTPIAEFMIELPATTFTMGSPPGLGEADEAPAHPVSLSVFAIDRTEVTVGHYWQCVLAGACDAPVANANPNDRHNVNDPTFDNHPISDVSWVQANQYCGWRGKRLPTEAEWEFAAGWDIEKQAKLIWSWGNDPPSGQANVGNTSSGQAVVVDQSASDRSPAGVLNMAGNVSEWVFDWYKVDYYSVADDTDPIGPTHRRGEGTGRVVRGGSFADSANEARSANRRHQAETYGYPTIGFRCAKDR